MDPSTRSEERYKTLKVYLSLPRKCFFFPEKKKGRNDRFLHFLLLLCTRKKYLFGSNTISILKSHRNIQRAHPFATSPHHLHAQWLSNRFIKRSERKKGDGIERKAPWITIPPQALREKKKPRLMEFLPRRTRYRVLNIWKLLQSKLLSVRNYSLDSAAAKGIARARFGLADDRS